MLVLSRKECEAVHIGPDIVITVVRLGRGRVQLGIDAPPHVRIRRDEIAQAGPPLVIGRGAEFAGAIVGEHPAVGGIEHCAG
jgi:carbon storage regulator